MSPKTEKKVGDFMNSSIPYENYYLAYVFVTMGFIPHLQDGSLVVTEQTLKIFETNNKEDLLPGRVIQLFQESEELKSLLSKAIRNGSSYDVVLTFKGEASQPKYIRCVTEPIVQKDKIVKLIGTYQDVSAQKEHELGLKLY